MKKLIFYLLFILLNISVAAQQDRNESWDMMLHINCGYSLTTSDWEYTHPYILGSGSFTGRISGTYEESYGFAGGIELSKGYLGGQVSVGIFPAKFSIKEQVDPGITQTRNDVYTYNSIFLEAEGILFPYGNPVDKISPFIKVGLGGMITSGDIKNNLLLLSGSGGVRIFISENLGLDLSINFRHMWLYNVKLTDQISAAYGVSLSALLISIGMLYQL